MFKSLAVSFALLLAAVAVAGAAGPELKTEDQKTLYALGLVHQPQPRQLQSEPVRARIGAWRA